MQLERQIEILKLLHSGRAVTISGLSSRFRVSQNTIRRDLKSLSARGIVKLTHGGALPIDKLQMGLPLSEREVYQIEEKRAIGMKAAEIIEDGEAIALDAGTTTEQIALAVAEKKNLTVITNGLNIAQTLSEAAGVTVVLIGGILNDITKCLAGFHAEQFISQFHVKKAFISAGGVSLDSITNTNAFEVQIKRRMMDIAEETYLVVTHHKIGKTSLAPFARMQDFNVLLTDKGADPKSVEYYRQKGIRVLLC